MKSGAKNPFCFGRILLSHDDIINNKNSSLRANKLSIKTANHQPGFECLRYLSETENFQD